MYWFDYSIIKYMPDSKRGEIVNIGFVVFRSTGIDIRILKNSAKPRIIDGCTNMAALEEFKQLVTEITADIDDTDAQHNIIKSFNSGIFISGKSSFSINEIGQYESKVNRLFNELVKPFSTLERKSSNSRLYTTIKEEFKRLKLLAESHDEIEKHKIVAHYPIGKDTGMSADFMLKNGKYHMTEIVDYDVNDTNAKFKETSLKLMAFNEGQRNISQNIGRYFVYRASSTKEREIITHLNLAQDYCDKIYNIRSKSDKAQYFELINSLAGQQRQLA